MTEMKVDAIKNGSVIDHLPPGKALDIIRFLRIDAGTSILIGTNLSSRKHGTKDILKIENHELSEDEVNTIALLAPAASLTIIRDFKILKKSEVMLPESISGVFLCPNPGCVTNHQKIHTRFLVRQNGDTRLKCGYCEKIYSADEVLPVRKG